MHWRRPTALDDDRFRTAARPVGAGFKAEQVRERQAAEAALRAEKRPAAEGARTTAELLAWRDSMVGFEWGA